MCAACGALCARVNYKVPNTTLFKYLEPDASTIKTSDVVRYLGPLKLPHMKRWVTLVYAAADAGALLAHAVAPRADANDAALGQHPQRPLSGSRSWLSCAKGCGLHSAIFPMLTCRSSTLTRVSGCGHSLNVGRAGCQRS